MNHKNTVPKARQIRELYVFEKKTASHVLSISLECGSVSCTVCSLIWQSMIKGLLCGISLKIHFHGFIKLYINLKSGTPRGRQR